MSCPSRLLVLAYSAWRDWEFFQKIMLEVHAVHGKVELVHRDWVGYHDIYVREWCRLHPEYAIDVAWPCHPAPSRVSDWRMVSSGIDEVLVFMSSEGYRESPAGPVERDLRRWAVLLGIKWTPFYYRAPIRRSYIDR